MRAATSLLLVGLAGALALYVWSRSKSGGVAVVDATGGVLDDLDIVASRVGALVTSRGYRNNNPGNIRYIDPERAWDGQIGNDGGYGVYATPQAGTRALGKELEKRERAGFRTVRDLIAGIAVNGGRQGGWAPAVENDAEAYVADVADELEVDPDQPIDITALLPQLARGIGKHENGYVDGAYNWQWVYLA